MSYAFRSSLLAILLWAAVPLLAADPPTAEKTPRTDVNGDPLPDGAILRLGSLRLRHAGRILAIKFSADGKTIISAGNDRTIRFWDSATGKEQGRITRPSLSMIELALCEEGKQIAAVDSAGALIVYDWESKKQIAQKLPGEQPLWIAHSFSADGSTLVRSSGAVIEIYDLKTEKIRKSISMTNHGIPALSPEGNLVADADEEGVHIFAIDKAKEFRTLKDPNVLGAAFAPDGKTLVALAQKGISLWDVESGKKLRTFESGSIAMSIPVFAPNGKMAAAKSQSDAGEWAIILWDPLSGKKLRAIAMDQERPFCIAFSPDDSKLAVGGTEGAVRLWETASGKPIELADTHGHNDPIVRMALTPDGKLIATGSAEGSVHLWDAATGKHLGALEGHSGYIVNVRFSPDGRLLITGDNTGGMLLWDVGQRKLLRTLAGSPGGLSLIGFGRDGKLVSLGRGDALVRICDPNTGAELRSFPVMEGFTSGSIANRSGHVITHYRNGTFRVWDIARGNLVSEIATESPGVRMAYTDDDRFLALLHDSNYIGVVETFTGKERFEVTLRITPTGADLSDDGNVLATHEANGLVRFWNPATGKELKRCAGHTARIRTTTYSPDGTKFLTGSEDGTVLVWDLRPLQPRNAPTKDLTAAQLKKLWKDLASADATVAHAAVQQLRAAPVAAVRFLADHLKPPAPADLKRLAKRIADLDSDDFDVRHKASEELARAGDSAEPMLRKALEGDPSPEMRQRIEHLLTRLANRAVTPEGRQAWRALEVLERIGGEDGRKLVQQLAEASQGSWLSEEAKYQLVRMLLRKQP